MSHIQSQCSVCEAVLYQIKVNIFWTNKDIFNYFRVGYDKGYKCAKAK